MPSHITNFGGGFSKLTNGLVIHLLDKATGQNGVHRKITSTRNFSVSFCRNSKVAPTRLFKMCRLW